MKKSNRNKSISSVTSTTNAPSSSTTPITSSTDLELFSSYSHEQVHIYNKLCSSISSICQIAYCTSEGIHICVPATYPRQSSSSTQNVSSSSSSPMLITRIAYPFESNDQTNSKSLNSSSNIFFEKLKSVYLKTLYQAYKHRPTSLSSFDRLLCSDTNQYKGFRQCLFSPFNIQLNHGQSILSTITCAHEVFIYDIVSSSKRFYHSEASNLIYDLTKILFETKQLEKFLHDSENDNDYRLLYIHLTTNILWDQSGKYFFQLQYSGHLIIWIFDGLKLVNQQSLNIIDTKISKPLFMIWNEDERILLIIGKENQRIIINIDQMKLVQVTNKHENDYMNAEYGELVKLNEKKLLLIETKINYCLIYCISVKNNQSSTYECDQIDYHLFPSPIIGIQQQSTSTTNHISILIGCEDGSMHTLIISRELPITIIDIKQVANGQIKSCSRKPLLLRHFNLSSNELLLARIFYSPIVAPNVKFGFVQCTLHRWINENGSTLDKMIENFLSKIDIPVWRSSDELAVILYEINRGTTHHYQMKKTTNENFVYLQRLCRLNSLLNNLKQLPTIENQLLQNYRQQLSKIFQLYFSKNVSKLSSIELLIYKICSTDEQLSSSAIFMCPMCNTPLTLNSNDLLFSTCSNKHNWPRCCRTLLPLTFEQSQTCSLCDRTIILIETTDQNYTNFVKYKDNDLKFFFSSLCTFCM